MGKTLFEKIWDDHLVDTIPNGPSVLYIDKHLIHEVTSPQAFDGIRARGIDVYRKEKVLATADHNVPTLDQHLPIKEALSRIQVEKLTSNCEEFDIEAYTLNHENQGIVHVIGPELGFTQPGMTMVCGDSHTSTHGAFGSIAFGIGTSEVEQVLATQCIMQSKPMTMRIEVNGELGKGVYSKDIVLYIIAQISAGGATGYFIEFAGSAITSLSMEARMTICNMSIEMGARGGLIAPDQTTFDYVKGRERAPKGDDWDKMLAYWKTLKTDDDAEYDKVLVYDAADITPMITYGTNPGMGIKISDSIPSYEDPKSAGDASSLKKAMDYMDLEAATPMLGKKLDYVFIGSCTNSRIEDLRLAASYVDGKQIAEHVTGWVVPGSARVLKQALKEGLDKVFTDAGFEFRGAGCSACLAMNDDKIPKGKYCVSTSNRNFEGRQGPGSRTFLASPMTAAASAVAGQIVDVSTLI